MHTQKTHPPTTPAYPRLAHRRARSCHPLILCGGIALLTFLAIALMPTSAYAQDATDELFTAAEMCEQVLDIFPALDDDERAIEVRIHEIEEEIEALRKVAEQFQSYISADASTGDINYANTMFWVTMLRLQGAKNELILQKAQLEQIAFDRELFAQIIEAFACGEEEEEEVAPALPSAQSSCHVTSSSAIPWDRLDEVTFLVIEDPNPTQEGQRWLEFRVATTHDVGARNPSIWLDRLIAWSEAQQVEGWIELARGGQGAFCNAIAANCITPPSGMSDDVFYRLCGGEE